MVRSMSGVIRVATDAAQRAAIRDGDRRRKETAMKTLDGLLARHPFFSGLHPRYLQLTTGCASNVRFNAGDLIFKEGEEADNFYLIRQGQVALELFAPGRGS
jgi:hypothetical protein